MGRRAPVAVAAGIAVALAAFGACNKSSASDGRPAPRASADAAPHRASGTMQPPPAVGPGADAGAIRAALTAKGPLLTKLRPYLHGTPPRRAFDEGRWQDCAVGFRSWLGAHPRHPERRAAATLMSLCEEHAGHSLQAARDDEALAADGGLIAPHLWLRAAECWLQAGRADEALAALGRAAVPENPRARRLARIRGRALRQKGEFSGAYKAFARAAGAGGDGALLLSAAEAAAGAGKPAEEARWLRRILVGQPAGDAARQARERLAELPAALRRLSPRERLERAERARKRFDRKLAVAITDQLLAESRKGGRTWCEAAGLRARALETKWRTRKRAAALYDATVRACPKAEWMAPIVYRAARRQMNSGSAARALELFAVVATSAPNSTLVDDAMRFRARILRGQGRDAEADATLGRILELKGDMVEYAGWDLLWRHASKHRWKACVATGRKILPRLPPEKRRGNAGRAAYWLGVCELRTGHRAAGRERLAKVVREHPWTWYGMLARERLSGTDVRLARRPSEPAPRADLLAPLARLLHDRHLLAGIELLRLGMRTSATAELGAAARGHTRSAEKMLWAALYAATGDFARATATAAASRIYEGRAAIGLQRAYWELAYPRPEPFRPAVARRAAELGVDPMFVWAIMRTESRFNPRATSPVLATGLLQLMVPTARATASRLGLRRRIDRSDLVAPGLNIRLGVAYMRRLLDRFGHYALVASSYNAGPHNTDKWRRRWPHAELDDFVERIPFRENRRYVKSVVTSWLRYRALYGEGAGAPVRRRLPPVGRARRPRVHGRRKRQLHRPRKRARSVSPRSSR